MPYTVKVNHPHFPEGTVFNVGGLDRVPNGGSLEVDEEMERLFIMQHGQSLEDAFANDATVETSGSSALDDDERKTLVEAYQYTFAPTGETAAVEELVDEGEPLVEKPTWLTGGEENA